MELIDNKTKEILSQYKPGTQSEKQKPLAIAKFFSPVGRGTWYVLEAEQINDDDWLFYGYVESPISPEFNEYGHFTLKELESVELPFGLKIERDIFFEPVEIESVMESLI